MCVNYRLNAYLSYAVQCKFAVLIVVMPLNLNFIYTVSLILRAAGGHLVFCISIVR